MKRLVNAWMLFCGLLIASTVAFAQSPVMLLQSLSDQMIMNLSKHRATMKNNPRVVYGIVRRVLLPHVDTTAMSRSVLGPNVWRQMSTIQRGQFVDEFVTLVVRVYSTALAQYTDEAVEIYPLRGNVESKSVVVVRTRILRPGGVPAVPVNYRLTRRSGRWLINDISVEGVSLARSYRTQFSPKIAQGSQLAIRTGIEDLIAELRTHNSKTR